MEATTKDPSLSSTSSTISAQEEHQHQHQQHQRHELNLIDSLQKDQPRPDSPQHVFPCNYCQRKFYSSQALGGHQNAHKRERSITKRNQRLGAFGPSSFLPTLPLHASIGIQLHSLIHKPRSYMGFGILYGKQGWSRLPIHHQPGVGKLGVDNFQVGSSSSPRRDGSVQTIRDHPEKLDLSLKL